MTGNGNWNENQKNNLINTSNYGQNEQSLLAEHLPGLPAVNQNSRLQSNLGNEASFIEYLAIMIPSKVVQNVEYNFV